MKIIKEINSMKIWHIISIVLLISLLIQMITEKEWNRVLSVLSGFIILLDLLFSMRQEKRYIKELVKLNDEKSSYIRKEEALNNYEIELLQNQTTVIMLQSQINPHFLYNTLDCIRGEAILVGAEELASMTKALSNFFSYSISKSGMLVTVREELESVENYFLIQQFRFNRRFRLTVEYNKEDKLILENVIPRLALQPIVENSISHGFRNTISECELSITIHRTENSLYIKCSDNGCGIPEKELDKITEQLENCVDYVNKKIKDKNTHGLGILNINRRIKLLFGNDYGLYITSMENVGTDVHIHLPFKDTGIEEF